MTSLLFFSLSVFCIAIFAGCEQTPAFKKQQYSGAIMGTTYHVTVVVSEYELLPDDLEADIFTALVAVDDAMSTYKGDSELSQLNIKDTTDWIPISGALSSVLSTGLEVSTLSAGAFDITVGPLVDAWGFGASEADRDVPADEIIEELRGHVGFQYLQLRTQPPALKKLISVQLDLSAIAKGFGVDQVAMVLDSHGVANYLVEVGGELRGKGHNTEGRLWRIGVERPALGHEGTVHTLSVDNKAIATSGDYRNYFEENGVRYSHTINPKTGRPVNHDLASVTVIADSATLADAWATAFNVMGRESAKRLAIEQNLAAFFIYKDQGVFKTESTESMQQYLLGYSE